MNSVLMAPNGPDGETFVEMQHVFVARGEVTVLHDVSLRVGAQEHLAILGPNGCGKSTLLQTITCQRYPIQREGSRLRIFGRERWDTGELRKHLGIVSAGFPGEQTPRTSGRDAVLSGFFSSSTLWPHQRVTPEMAGRAEEILSRLEALHLRDKPLREMSSGESRRIMIGRALVHAPQVLLLDEPSNGLDLAAQAELRRTLRRLAGQGVGILLITHHLADILPEMDRVVLMGSGRILADGPKRDMLTRERLSALFQTDVEVAERDGFCHAW